MTLGHQNNEPADCGFQFLEDLSTAYWYSHVLFSALELELFGLIEAGADSPEKLAGAAGCDPGLLVRLLGAMSSLGLIGSHGGCMYNSQACSRFLVPGKDDYMGDFLLYRRFMIPKWQGLTEKVSCRDKAEAPEFSYQERNFRYVASMDSLVRQKAGELAGLVDREEVAGAMLDVGGGAGSLSRALVSSGKMNSACLFDLPEVIDAAHRLYATREDWKNITSQGGDFRTHSFDEKYDLVCLSNFLHAYGREEARELFLKAVSLLNEEGLLLIHDYFPDRKGVAPQKGALYDLNMMLNTFNGVCHDAGTLCFWCREAGLKSVSVKDLSTDSGVVMARRMGVLALEQDELRSAAENLGFCKVVPISPSDVVTVSWAREKCRFGCRTYGKNLQCPPGGLDHQKTRQLLDEYQTAYLLRGTPPGDTFHRQLLSLEKHAFLLGRYKAFVLSAGPCAICSQCPEDGQCRFPHLARPSMEGSGIDVYATAIGVGIDLHPVQEKGHYVTYIGLLLVE